MNKKESRKRKGKKEVNLKKGKKEKSFFIACECVAEKGEQDKD